MGLLDRNKHKPAPAPASAEPAALAPGAAPALVSPLTSADPNSLRDMLIAAFSARDQKLFKNLVHVNRQSIGDNFGEWQKVPDAIRENGGAMQRYANTLIALAELFRDQYHDPSLAEKLAGPSPDTVQRQWEQALSQSEALSRELRFDEASTLLRQVLSELATVPKNTPIPFHAVTHARLAQTLFATAQADAAADQAWEALQLSQQRNEDNGIAAALRGLYEIHRYLGKFPQAADFGDRLSAKLAQMGNTADADFWTRQSAIVRAGEPLCRVVFFLNDRQVEVDDVPKLAEARLRYGFIRNRPPISLCEGLVQRGMQLGSQSKFEEALATFNEAAGIDPLDPNPHFQAAVTLMHLMRPADAVAAYDKVEELAPGWFNCRAERWLASEVAEGRLQPPVYFITRTEEMPESTASWVQKLALVEEAIQNAGEIPPLSLYRGRCLMRIGKLPEAEQALRQALEKSREPDTRTRLLVDLQMLVNDPEERHMLLSEAVALNGNLAAAAVARVTLKQAAAVA